MVCLSATGWRCPVSSLSRLFWLGTPLKIEGLEAAPRELRTRSEELNGPDIALVVGAMRNQDGLNAALMQKIVVRLKVKGLHAGLSATDLVELAEGLAELDIRDEDALRALG